MQSLYFKKGISFLSTSPLSYAVELTAESPIFHSGFGCSSILPLADCVKSALTLLLGIKNLCSSFLEKHCPNTGASEAYTNTKRALSLSPAGAGGIACGQQREQSHILRVTSLAYCWKTIKILLLERNEMSLFFNRNVINKLG